MIVGTPLHTACLKGNFEIVKYLVEHGANIHSTDKFNRTPIFYAIKSLDIVKYLVKKGSNINQRDIFNNTLLHYASGNKKMIIGKHYS